LKTLGNLASALRVIPLFLSIYLIVSNVSTLWKSIGIVLLWITFLSDSLDGYLSRKYNTASKFGGVVDVMFDRLVEASYWVAFLFIGFVPLWIVLGMLLRYFVTDGFRTVAFSANLSTFDMMKSKLGYALVASRISRGLINTSKIVTFTYLSALTLNIPFITAHFTLLSQIGIGLAIYLLLFNLARGFVTVKDTVKTVNDMGPS